MWELIVLFIGEQKIKRVVVFFVAYAVLKWVTLWEYLGILRIEKKKSSHPHLETLVIKTFALNPPFITVLLLEETSIVQDMKLNEIFLCFMLENYSSLHD